SATEGTEKRRHRDAESTENSSRGRPRRHRELREQPMKPMDSWTYRPPAPMDLSTRGPSRRGSPDISLHSVGQTGTVEVEQQAEMQTAGSEVAEDLRLEDGIEARHALHFDDDRAFDDEVDPV